MPSKKRKYNARFPAGRIKKIMQTDEEVGKVAQAVPIIISRTLELFVESLLSKAMQVTVSRNAKTLSPSHVKQCILAESRFDFLRDLVKNIPDVAVAEEKEITSDENSPNSSRFPEAILPPRRLAREDSNSSGSSDVRVQINTHPRENLRRAHSADSDIAFKNQRIETITSAVVSNEVVDLSKKVPEKPIRAANFYNETLPDDVQHRSVITVNPTYSSPQPSTSNYSRLAEPVKQIEIQMPKHDHMYYIDLRKGNTNMLPPAPSSAPVTPILNIDFSKNVTKPEIKMLDNTAANIVGVKNDSRSNKVVHRQYSKSKLEVKKTEVPPVTQPIDIDSLNSGNLQIDEDYDT